MKMLKEKYQKTTFSFLFSSSHYLFVHCPLICLFSSASLRVSDKYCHFQWQRQNILRLLKRANKTKNERKNIINKASFYTYANHFRPSILHFFPSSHHKYASHNIECMEYMNQYGNVSITREKSISKSLNIRFWTNFA